MQGLIADDRRLQSVQFLLKSPGLIGLKESRVEQHEADVTQGKDANGKEKISAPTETRILSHRKRHQPLNSDLHWVARLPARVEISRVHSNRRGCGRTGVRAPVLRLVTCMTR